MKWIFMALAALALLAAAALLVKRRQEVAPAHIDDDGAPESGPLDGDVHPYPAEGGVEYARASYPTTVTQEEVQR